ncbi:hypothetical protein ACGFYQ_33815 [Streptomyces sp. NPDC048258]|uniref:hypothetical protein n=1 Tax=Streptomyces sp. NPDC048258 TaxID=3365527 RepID=UPI00371C733E
MNTDALIRDALTNAGYAPTNADVSHPHSALALNLGYLPGEIWVSDPDGHTLYAPEEHHGLWARYYPDPTDGGRFTNLYASDLTDLTADISGLLAALTAITTPASPQLAAQLADRKDRLNFVSKQADGGGPEVASLYGAAADRLRTQLERITLSVIADNARPCRQASTAVRAAFKAQPAQP